MSALEFALKELLDRSMRKQFFVASQTLPHARAQSLGRTVRSHIENNICDWELPYRRKVKYRLLMARKFVQTLFMMNFVLRFILSTSLPKFRDRSAVIGSNGVAAKRVRDLDYGRFNLRGVGDLVERKYLRRTGTFP